jgi:hypothetical protein
MTDKAKVLNSKMVRFLPELASVYAQYPLAYDRWRNPTERGPNGEPCFIASSQDNGIHEHYTYSKRAPNGPGYYHLLTKMAYISLYGRITQIPPSTCCCSFSAETRQAMDSWDDVRRLMYNRSVAPTPNDSAGQQAAISNARDTAQAWHNGLQNEQLVMGAVGTGFALG